PDEVEVNGVCFEQAALRPPLAQHPSLRPLPATPYLSRANQDFEAKTPTQLNFSAALLEVSQPETRGAIVSLPSPPGNQVAPCF
ncbi:MAG TPA: hypothetical protein VGR71_06755, partial [Nitrospira sp.]|nr:hypothetical protein [Nitrospira sp.]